MTSNRYISGIIFGALLVCGFWAAYYAYLYRIGEASLHYVVEQQTRTDSRILYMSGLNHDYYSYKQLLYRAVPHDIVALGSSRAMFVSRELVKENFFNLGGTVNALSQLESISREILSSNKKPKLVLLFTDIWWFNNEYSDKYSEYQPDYSPVNGNFTSMPLVWSKLRSFGKLKRSLRATNRLGLDAIFQKKGFDRYGTLVFFNLIDSRQGEAPDAHFQDTLRRIKYGNHRFEKQEIVSEDVLRRFENVIKLYESAGVEIVPILPPFPLPVVQAVEKGGYGYVGHLKKRLSEKGFTLYDYSDPRRIPGSSSCEFLDGFHGGEVIYARMFLELIQKRPDLKTYLDPSVISQYIDKYSGWVMPYTLRYAENTTAVEGDFLDLGCRGHSPSTPATNFTNDENVNVKYIGLVDRSPENAGLLVPEGVTQVVYRFRLGSRQKVEARIPILFSKVQYYLDSQHVQGEVLSRDDYTIVRAVLPESDQLYLVIERENAEAKVPVSITIKTIR